MAVSGAQDTALHAPASEFPRASGDVIRLAVAAHFGFTVGDLRSPRRTARLVLARHAAMWITRKATSHSLPAIGRLFGHRDHTTVMYAIGRIDARMAADPAFDAEMRALLLPFLPAVPA